MNIIFNVLQIVFDVLVIANENSAETQSLPSTVTVPSAK